VERDFDPSIADDFADFFSDIILSKIPIPQSSTEDDGSFAFRTIDLMECIKAFESGKSIWFDVTVSRLSLSG
jgi:hypothetical protein